MINIYFIKVIRKSDRGSTGEKIIDKQRKAVGIRHTNVLEKQGQKLSIRT